MTEQPGPWARVGFGHWICTGTQNITDPQLMAVRGGAAAVPLTARLIGHLPPEVMARQDRPSCAR